MIEPRLRELAEAWLAAGRAAIVVEVAGARGSVPRGPGTRMMVSRDAFAGTIGGGHLELKAITAARAMLERGDLAAREHRYPLGPALGQCCGGVVVLSLALLNAAALARWRANAPLFHLQLHGAGHVGRAIATLLATLDGEVDWFDERDDEFPPLTTLGSTWPAHIRRISADTIEREVAAAPAGALYLVATHEHALDFRIAEAVLRRADFAYFGLIGSATKRAAFVRRFIDRGIDAADVARMTCPIGLPGIDGKAPEVIAASVVAQLLQAAARARPAGVPARACAAR